MERKIGEVFKHNGKVYQCLMSGTCAGCDLNSGGNDCMKIIEARGACVGSLRSDKTPIIFKELKKIGEPTILMGKMVQEFKNNNDNRCEYCCFNKDCHPLDIASICDLHNSFFVEIKEDMEEKKIQHYDCFFDKKEKDKLNLKPFDLNAAKLGKPVCTRDGRKARIICFDRINGDYYKIVACVTDFDGDFEEVLFYGIDGYIVDSQNPKDQDLMILSEKKKGWVNIVRGSNGSPHMGRGIFQSKEEAENAIKAFSDNLIDTVKINWEE